MEKISVDVQLGGGGGAFSSSFSSAFSRRGWVSTIRDVRNSVPITCSYGINGTDPSDCVADPGVMSFAYDNSQHNSTQTIGWYSPLNAVKRGKFDFNIPVRLTVSYAGIANIPIFVGKLANIQVTPGLKEERIVRCTVFDLMDDYMDVPAPALDNMFNANGADVVTAILNALPFGLQPTSREIDPGLNVFPIALDNVREEETSVRELLIMTCKSDLSRFYIIAGKAVLRNRHYAALNPGVQFVVDGHVMRRGGLEVPGTREDLISKVQVTVHSTRTDQTTDTVLFDRQTATTRIAPRETNTSIFGAYRDPNNPGDRISGTDMQPIEPFVDYTMNTSADGTGVDVTANFTATASYASGGGVRYTITNNGDVAGFVTRIQSRGRGIYRFPVVIEKEVTAEYGPRILQYDMPFLSNTNTGDDVATHLQATRANPLARVRSLTFLANQSQLVMNTALAIQPGSSRVSVTEPVVGLEAEQFLFHRKSFRAERVQGNALLWCTLSSLEPTTTQRFWITDIEGSSNLGVTTWLGF